MERTERSTAFTPAAARGSNETGAWHVWESRTLDELLQWRVRDPSQNAGSRGASEFDGRAITGCSPYLLKY